MKGSLGIYNGAYLCYQLKLLALRAIIFLWLQCSMEQMATMLNGVAIMDRALLLIAANESCPQSQTFEHLAAVKIMCSQHLIVLQNKIDLVQENEARNHHEAIQKFIQVARNHHEAIQKFIQGRDSGIAMVLLGSPRPLNGIRAKAEGRDNGIRAKANLKA
ncbi:hypothetical protein K1719_013097 [Acacia pycnantha]|nr:hypothetical protein K1719_013097 [Acacia pycnantha]